MTGCVENLTTNKNPHSNLENPENPHDFANK